VSTNPQKIFNSSQSFTQIPSFSDILSSANKNKKIQVPFTVNLEPLVTRKVTVCHVDAEKQFIWVLDQKWVL